MEYREVGKRIKQRLVELGYGKSADDLDIERFSWDHRFGRTNIYNWLGDKAVPFKDLTRLCDALRCTEVWLLTGKERDPKAQPGSARQHGKLRSLLLALSVGGGLALPSPGMAGEADYLSVGTWLNPVHLIGSWRRFRNSFRGFGPGMACAA
jgi:hypothetical protein